MHTSKSILLLCISCMQKAWRNNWEGLGHLVCFWYTETILLAWSHLLIYFVKWKCFFLPCEVVECFCYFCHYTTMFVLDGCVILQGQSELILNNNFSSYKYGVMLFWSYVCLLLLQVVGENIMALITVTKIYFFSLFEVHIPG